MKKVITAIVIISLLAITAVLSWLLLQRPSDSPSPSGVTNSSSTSQELIEQSGSSAKGGPGKANSGLSADQERNINKKLNEPPAND